MDGIEVGAIIRGCRPVTLWPGVPANRQGLQQTRAPQSRRAPASPRVIDVGRVLLSDRGVTSAGRDLVPALPPISGAVPPSPRISAICPLDAAAASVPSRNSRASSRPTRSGRLGLAMRAPAMSFAEPCTARTSTIFARLVISRRRDADRADHRRSEIGHDVRRTSWSPTTRRTIGVATNMPPS